MTVLLMAGVQFLAYLNLTVNYRAIALDQPLFAMLTDGLAVLLGVTIIRRVSRTDSSLELAGMVVGGSLAAYVGIALTRAWGN
jgi:hypothetical protein